MLKKLSILMTALVLSGLMATPTSAHRVSAGTYTTNGLSMRTCASTSCHRIRVIPAHSRVRVKHCRRGWCKVSYHGNRGFVSKRYLSRGGNKFHRHHRRGHHRGHRSGIQLRFHIGL